MPFSCPGCRKHFTSSRAVGSHRGHCQSYKDAPTTILKKRRQDFDQIFQAKRRRKEAQEPEVVVFEHIPLVSTLVHLKFLLKICLVPTRASARAATRLSTVWSSLPHPPATKTLPRRITSDPPSPCSPRSH